MNELNVWGLFFETINKILEIVKENFQKNYELNLDYILDPKYAAIDTRSTPMVELLLSRGIDIEERRSGMSPEQYATSKGLSKISELIRTTKQNQQSYAISVG